MFDYFLDKERAMTILYFIIPAICAIGVGKFLERHHKKYSFTPEAVRAKFTSVCVALVLLAIGVIVNIPSFFPISSSLDEVVRTEEVILDDTQKGLDD